MSAGHETQATCPPRLAPRSRLTSLCLLDISCFLIRFFRFDGHRLIRSHCALLEGRQPASTLGCWTRILPPVIPRLCSCQRQQEMNESIEKSTVVFPSSQPLFHPLPLSPQQDATGLSGGSSGSAITRAKIPSNPMTNIEVLASLPSSFELQVPLLSEGGSDSHGKHDRQVVLQHREDAVLQVPTSAGVQEALMVGILRQEGKNAQSVLQERISFLI